MAAQAVGPLDDLCQHAVRGQDILIYGSGALVNTLMRNNLIDVYRVMLYPLALGSGKRFFRDGSDKTTLTLSDVKTNGAGVVMLTYQPAMKDAEGSAANQRGDRSLGL